MAKRKERSSRKAAGIVCPHCGSLLGEEDLQAIYELRRRQIGGRIGGAAKKPKDIPEGWISISDAATSMGVKDATLRKRAERGNPLVYRKFGGHWAVLKELAR